MKARRPVVPSASRAELAAQQTRIARDYAAHQLAQAIEASERHARELRDYLERFNAAENDRARVDVLNYALTHAARNTGARIDLLAMAQARLHAAAEIHIQELARLAFEPH